MPWTSKSREGERSLVQTPQADVSLLTLLHHSQQTYVESNGAFGFTQAHSAYVPPGADIAGVAAYDRGYLVTTKGSGWTACQTAGSTSGPAPAPPLYKIFARLPGLAFNASCVNLNIVTVGKAGNVYGAWQYT